MNLHKIGIIDTHCHMWQIEITSKTWLSPEFKKLYQTFGPVDFIEDTKNLDVDACILIEAGRTDRENEVLQNLANLSDKVVAFIPYLDLRCKTFADELDKWSENPKFLGIRMGFEGVENLDFLKCEQVRENLKILSDKKLIFEFLVTPNQLKEVVDIYKERPELIGVIEHLAKPNVFDKEEQVEWQKWMRELAENTNIFCKLSWSPHTENVDELLDPVKRECNIEATKTYIDFLIEEFGWDRLMWGSDWPNCNISQSYEEMLNIFQELLGDITAKNYAGIFRENAVNFYGLNL